MGGSTRRRPGQAGACASGLWASASPQMRLRIGPRSLRIGPSGKQQPLGKARPGPTRSGGRKPQGSASHPRRRFYRNGGRLGRCSLPERNGYGNATAPFGNSILAAPLPRGTRGTPAHGAGKPPSQPADKAKTSAYAGGPENQARPVCGLVCGPSGGWGQNAGCAPPLWRLARPSLIFWPFGGVCCGPVCCCLSCVSCWSGLVARLPVWWRVWLVSCPLAAVSLAVCFGGGVCLSAGGGVCAWLFLALWCGVWPSARGAVLWPVLAPFVGKKAPAGNQQPGRGL